MVTAIANTADSSGLALAALVISVLSLTVAGASFGWNIYKEIGLRARIGVDLFVATLFGGLPETNEMFVVVKCVNKGPGKVKLDNLNLKFQKLLDGGRIEQGYAITMYDHNHPYSSKLPTSLDVGETANFLIPFTADCFLKHDVTEFSVSDTFGRDHKVKPKRISLSRSKYVKEFVIPRSP